MATRSNVATTTIGLVLGAAATYAVGTSGGLALHDTSPAAVLTTNGDLLTRAAGVPARLGIGASATLLRSTGSAPAWASGTTVLDDLASTRGYLLRRGASAWEGLDAHAADTFLGGDGSDLAVRTAAQALASLDGARVTSWDFSSSSGWLLVQGNGTAAITGGVASFTTANGVNTTPNNAPTASVAIPAGVDPWRGFDLTVRLASFTGSLGTGNRAWVSAQTLADGRNGTYPAATDFALGVIVKVDGTLTIGTVVSGTFTTLVTTATSTTPLGGTGWIRIQARGALWSVYAATSASLPTTWTRYYAGLIGAAATDTTARSQIAYVTLCGYRADAQAESHVVTWDDLRITGLL